MIKFAILTDSGANTPSEFIAQYPVYVAPLSVIFKDGAYRDNIDITADEVVQRFDEEIPSTSLPTVAEIHDKLCEIRADGYESVMIVTISSGLSGTMSAMKTAAKDFPDMNFSFVDSLNIGIACGMVVAYAAKLSGMGLSLEEATPKVQDITGNTKVFFCIPTLSFLRKGGRIGLVAGFVGTALGLRPIITCNSEGIYDTIQRARGWTRAVDMALEMAVSFRNGIQNFNIAVAHSRASEEAKTIMHRLKSQLPEYRNAFMSTISPALTVHTGPGLIGIGLQRLPDPIERC